MIKVIKIIIYMFMVPTGFGIIYDTGRSIGREEEDSAIADLWIKGFAIMVAFFSLVFQICKVFGEVLDEGIWNICCVVVIFLALLIVGVRLIKKKIHLVIIEGELLPAYVTAFLFFVLGLLLLKTSDYDHHLEQYIWSYSDSSLETGIFEYGLFRFYMTVNKLLGISADRFLKVIMGLPLIMLSLKCYAFLGERLAVEKKKRSWFIILIYVVYIVTVFNPDYHLYGIYTNIWEPLTAYVTIYLPFQLGMMLYIEEIVYGWADKMKGDLFVCIIWIMVAFCIGYMYQWREWIIILAPEFAGAVIGLMRRSVKGGGLGGSVF